jgi:D-sedoheptulose 7-phosphate isomerase
MNDFNKQIDSHMEAIKTLTQFDQKIDELILTLKHAIRSNNKIFFCGNGGSASDSEHLCAEFIGRFKNNRRPYAAISLNSNIANITCISNDYGYDQLFARQLEALATKDDILFMLTTSGNSKNIVEVMKQAKIIGMKTVAFLGKDGGDCKNLADFEFLIKSNNTARIQECHMFLGHFLCSAVDEI